jgi:hypothetical protein
MHSKRKGDIAEQRVIARLLELGLEVFTPVGENTKVDLIYINDGERKSVQVKSSRIKNGCVKFNTAKVHSNSSSNHRETYEDYVDCFIVYNSDLECFLYFDIETLPSTEKFVRFEEPDSKYSSTHNSDWVEDNLLENHI